MEQEQLTTGEPSYQHKQLSPSLFTKEPDVVEELRAALHGLMFIEEITLLTNEKKPLVQFGGQLMEGDQDTLVDEIVQRFEQLGYTPLLSWGDNIHTLQAIPQVVKHKTGKVWINALLFIFTVLSVLLVGALRELNAFPNNLQELWLGWPFTLTLLSILTAHELSHYFVGRQYNSPVSLPYFIPMPASILGTMGAVIVQRGLMRSRKAIFDIGIAGPIGGLIIAVPLLFIGLAFTEVGHPSQFMDLPTDEPIEVSQEGNSLLYLAAKYVIHRRILPDKSTGEDVWLSPPSRGGSIVFAAWAGLLVTAFNLFPIGQLDGGHIAYAMWGRTAWKVARSFMYLTFAWGILLIILGNIAGTTWLVWGSLGTFMGHKHPPPLNDITPLDAKRKRLGWIMVAIFFLILIPIPLVNVVM